MTRGERAELAAMLLVSGAFWAAAAIAVVLVWTR